MTETKTIKVDYLARVEGEGALYIEFEKETVKTVKLKIFEPPRFFESLLQGRHAFEAPDITSRICGICPVAYLMSACHAIEHAAGVVLPDELRTMRRLLYCGEWIKSHALHIFMLHLPDFLGYPDAMQLAKDKPKLIENGLRIKKVGNQLMSFLGGRDIHPVNVKVGGFFKIPSHAEFEPLKKELSWALKTAIKTFDDLVKLNFPEYQYDYHFVAMTHPEEYPFNEGYLASNQGLKFAIPEFENYFIEKHVEHSTALHTLLKDKGNCLVGPMARLFLNHQHLTPKAKRLFEKHRLLDSCFNPFKSILVRMIEVIFALEHAIEIIDMKLGCPTASVPVDLTKSVEGMGCTEAPRGLCYHRYQLDEKGMIEYAKIVPPTTINQTMIEEDLSHLVKQYIHEPDDKLQHYCEQGIRNYDPCISCSTHFLDLTVKRS